MHINGDAVNGLADKAREWVGPLTEAIPHLNKLSLYAGNTLNAAEKTRRKPLSDLVHEINTKLTSINGAVDKMVTHQPPSRGYGYLQELCSQTIEVIKSRLGNAQNYAVHIDKEQDRKRILGHLEHVEHIHDVLVDIVAECKKRTPEQDSGFRR